MTRRQILERIANGKISRGAAAKLLEVSERHVNRLMKAAGVTRPPSAVHARRAAAQERRERIAKLAVGVQMGAITLDRAAARARLTPRSMYRWVAKVSKLSPKRTKLSKNKAK